MSAVMGTVVGLKTMADGTVRLTLDMQCSLTDLAALGTDPGTPYGLARIAQQAATETAQSETIQQEEKEALGPLAKWAVMRCKEPEFMEFIRNRLHGDSGVSSEEATKQAICSTCGITSRRELDSDSAAARIFLEQIMRPWMRSPMNPHREAA